MVYEGKRKKIEGLNVCRKSILASTLLYFNMCCHLFPIFGIVIVCVLITCHPLGVLKLCFLLAVLISGNPGLVSVSILNHHQT